LRQRNFNSLLNRFLLSETLCSFLFFAVVEYKVTTSKAERTSAPSPDGVEVKFAAYPNWFTDHGVWLKQKLLQAEGFPMPTGWMMVTLTVDPEFFDDCPLAAYKKCNPLVSRYMKDCAKKLTEWGYFKEERFCVNWKKFEFQRNGFPHWHVFTNLMNKVTPAQLDELRKMWKFGRLRYDQCDRNAHYAFKYAFKAPLKKFNRHSLDNAVPSWFANYQGVKPFKTNYFDENGEKQTMEGFRPDSFDRCRFFQRSKNFLKNFSDWLVSEGKNKWDYKVIVPRRKEDEKKSSLVARPVWLVLEEQLRKVQIISRDANGDYLRSTTIRLAENFAFYQEFLMKGIFSGDVISIKPNHYFMEDFPVDFVGLTDKHKLTKICKQNQMSLRKARKLQLLAFQLLNQVTDYDSKE